MLIYFLLLYCAIFLNPEVSATGEHEIKRGQYPFMAFLYYPDDKLLEETGSRFLRGAILIHESWLISASIETKSEIHVGFPRKTLLARCGATHIDANFTLNEDEDEQEREIVQVVRPKQYNKSEWWLTDINLLKTLLPFNLTSTVKITPFRSRPEVLKQCSILVYSAHHHNSSADKILLKLHIKLYFSNESCGSYFNKDTMICGGEREKSAHGLAHTNFCEGNRGSPLICEGDVVGLQTYIDNCKPPYLYNLFFAWDKFISCAVEEKCSEEKCHNVCTSLFKDEDSQKAATKKAAIHSVPTYFIDTEVSKNDTSTTLMANNTMNHTTKPTLTGKTTLNILRNEDEEATTTQSSVITRTSNVTALNVTINVTQSTNITETTNVTIITTTTRRIFPGYFFESTESSEFNDNVSSVTSTPLVVTNLTNTTKPEITTDMTAEAAQGLTETYAIQRAHPEHIEGRIDIFNESIRTYTKYEPNSESITSRMHGEVEEDSNDNESAEIGVTVTPRRSSTVGTHYIITTGKHQANTTEIITKKTVTDNNNVNTETFWPIQKIATIPRMPNNSHHDKHFERRARMESQQHRVRGRLYRSAANSNQLSTLMFLNILAVKYL